MKWRFRHLGSSVRARHRVMAKMNMRRWQARIRHHNHPAELGGRIEKRYPYWTARDRLMPSPRFNLAHHRATEIF